MKSSYQFGKYGETQNQTICYDRLEF